MSRVRTVAISLASVALAMAMTVAGCGLSSPSKDWPVPNESSYGISEEKMLIKDAKLPNEVTLGQIKKLVK